LVVSRDVFLTEGLKVHIVGFQDSKLSKSVQNGLGMTVHVDTKREDIGHQEKSKESLI